MPKKTADKSAKGDSNDKPNGEAEPKPNLDLPKVAGGELSPKEPSDETEIAGKIEPATDEECRIDAVVTESPRCGADPETEMREAFDLYYSTAVQGLAPTIANQGHDENALAAYVDGVGLQIAERMMRNREKYFKDKLPALLDEYYPRDTDECCGVEPETAS